MRRFKIKMDEIVATVRARLSALMRRPRILTRIHRGEAAAIEDAAREAFRASTTLKARKPFASVPAAGSQATVSGAVRPVATVAAPTLGVEIDHQDTKANEEARLTVAVVLPLPPLLAVLLDRTGDLSSR